MKSYVPLHTHSVFSIRDAVAKIPDYMEKAHKLNIPAFALTDHGTAAGSMHLIREANKYGIKPILGFEAYVANRSRFDKESGVDGYYHLTLLAMNNKGWENISRLIGESYNPDAFYNRPRIDRELLRRYNEGIICLSGCPAGNLTKQIKFQKNFEELKLYSDNFKADNLYPFIEETPEEVVQWHKNVFGDRYYIEIQNHKMGEVETLVNQELFRLADEFKIKTVLTGDTHFVNKQDDEIHNIMLTTRLKTTFKDTPIEKIKYPGEGYYLMDYEEMSSLLPNGEELLETTLEIADRCNTSFEFNNSKLPQIVPPEKEEETLISLVEDGLKKIYGKNLPKEVIERAEHELKVIFQMDVINYFLMVTDFLKWGKDENIPIGLGRGSISGSLVAYALGIHEVDTLKYGLLFSRFLNRGRAAYPNIDFDEFSFEKFKEKK